MGISLRNFTAEPGFGKDYHQIWDFLLRINHESVVTPGFTWGRWEWMFSLALVDDSNLSKIGIWEDSGVIVGVVTYEDTPGYAYLLLDPCYSTLKEPMLDYALNNLTKEGDIKILIPDYDADFQRIATSKGLRATTDREEDSIFDTDCTSMDYTLPEGFSVTTMAKGYDIRKYNRVLWRGFNHEGEPSNSAPTLAEREKSLSGGPHVNLDIKIAVVNPDGEYVSYCGMWYEPGSKYALVEPVATDPDYRRMGLGRAAVLEGVKRCAALGAQQAYVGSSQQFYYSIGFRPIPSSTWWN